MKLLLTISFYFSLLSVAAQNLKYIPDVNLKNELSRLGYTTNDSLDIRKVKGYLQLDIKNKNIYNTDGLQYFKQVWNLNISKNKIENLNFLPPNLTSLNCSHNNITTLSFLPPNLSGLNCSFNAIKHIDSLSPKLSFLNISNNQLKKLPINFENYKYLNYYNNPIDLKVLPKTFKEYGCDNGSMNCLPNEFIDWNILNENIKNLDIKSVKVDFYSGYSWGFGSKLETINYKKKCKSLKSKKRIIIRNSSTIITNYTINEKRNINYSDVQSLLMDIKTQKLKLEFTHKDSLVSINLKNKQNGALCGSDCTTYGLTFTFFTKVDSFKLHYYWDTPLELCGVHESEDIKDILNWLYTYKLVKVFNLDSKMINYYFSESILKRILVWNDNY